MSSTNWQKEDCLESIIGRVEDGLHNEAMAAAAAGESTVVTSWACEEGISL